MAGTARWYVVHTYSGYENTVKATIEKTVESRQLQDQILAISIPMETVTEITESGVSKTYDRKVFPGYVLVKMVYSDDTWHVIRNVRGVTGFVGTSSNDPTPLSEDEVYEMGVEKREIVVNYAVGDTVRILDGPLSSFTGTVETIEDPDRIANGVVDNDLALLNAHLINFFFGEGGGVVAGAAHEAGDSANIPDHMPSVIAVNHLDQHITGVDLTVVGFACAGLGDLGDSFQGNGNGEDLILEITAFHCLFNGSLHSVFITGIGMDYIPSCSFCHNVAPIRTG